jgi:hypothetical protein
MLRTIVLGLITWRLTSLLVAEDGPFDIFAKFRHFLGVRYNAYSEPFATNMTGRMILCHWCTSIWVAAGVAWFWGYAHKVKPYVGGILLLSTISITYDEILQAIRRIGR